MKIFRSLLVLFSVLAFALTAFSATIKRPLTVANVADQYYMEWTGTAGVVTADDLDLMADTTTANVYGADPAYLRMSNNKSASLGPWRSFAGTQLPEKACVSVSMTGDADATTADVYLLQAATKNGTHLKVGATAQTVTSVATTSTIEIAFVPLNPFLFFKVKIDPTTATDSVEITAVRVYPCND